MSLAADFVAFYAEHRRCGELDNSSLENVDRVIVTCTCGAVFNRLIQESDRSDHPSAQFKLGVKYARSEGVLQDYAEAVEWFRRAAVQGHAGAQNNLGFMHAHGCGVPQEYAEAVKWFRRAAELGHAGAQFNLGRRYAEGQGIPQDYAEAVKWFRRAAEQGFADAQNDLGFMHAHGRGALHDYVIAHMWFNLAASRQQPGADRDRSVKNRDVAASKMTLAQIAEAQRLARDWRPKPEQPSQ